MGFPGAHNVRRGPQGQGVVTDVSAPRIGDLRLDRCPITRATLRAGGAPMVPISHGLITTADPALWVRLNQGKAERYGAGRVGRSSATGRSWDAWPVVCSRTDKRQQHDRRFAGDERVGSTRSHM
jgi:hypothetical protein